MCRSARKFFTSGLYSGIVESLLAVFGFFQMELLVIKKPLYSFNDLSYGKRGHVLCPRKVSVGNVIENIIKLLKCLTKVPFFDK